MLGSPRLPWAYIQTRPESRLTEVDTFSENEDEAEDKRLKIIIKLEN